MSSYTEKAEPIAQKIKSNDFEGAYAIYFKEMEGGIAECPLDMIDFGDEIKCQVNNDETWEKWEEWTWEHESQE